MNMVSITSSRVLHPKLERNSRADVSAGHVEVGNGFTEEADDTDQAAGVEAGAIATVEADATTAKTIELNHPGIRYSH